MKRAINLRNDRARPDAAPQAVARTSMNKFWQGGPPVTMQLALSQKQRTAARLGQQLVRLDETSRALCFEHALHCFDYPGRKKASIYTGYVAAVAHENMRRMKSGPCLLMLASRSQFRRVVEILNASRHLTPHEAAWMGKRALSVDDWRKMHSGMILDLAS